ASQRRGDRAAGRPAHLPVWFAQERQRLFERQLPAIDLDADAGAQLLEQARPRRVADWAEVGQDPLLGLGQLMRPELASLFDAVPVPRRLGVRIQARR